MQMILRNTEKYLDLIEFSLSNCQARRLDREEGQHADTNGFFCELAGNLFGLGASEGKIYVIIEGQAFSHEDLTTSCTQHGEESEFIAKSGASTLCSVIYKSEKTYWNFFPMEDEDVDQLLLIHNILSSSERRQVFLSNN